jgi:hypothetical protein
MTCGCQHKCSDGGGGGGVCGGATDDEEAADGMGADHSCV